MDTSDFDWETVLESTGLGKPLLMAPVEDFTVTLHWSEQARAYHWFVLSPETAVLGTLDTHWKALQIALQEVIIGLLPQGAATAEARLGETGESVAVHIEPKAYWLVVPLAQEVTITFTDLVGGVIWETLIHPWHHLHDPLHRPDQSRLYWTARYKLSQPLVMTRVGDSEITIHRQEAIPSGPHGRVLDLPVGTLWGIRCSTRGGGSGGPLKSIRDNGQAAASDLGCMYIGKHLRVCAGTLPPNAASVEAAAGKSMAVRVELTPELFHTVIPSREMVVVTVRDQAGETLVRHQLPPLQQPRMAHYSATIWQILSVPVRMRMWAEDYFDLGVRPNVSYLYSWWGQREVYPSPSESTTIRGSPPELPTREQQNVSWLLNTVLILAVVMLAAAGRALWRAWQSKTSEADQV